MSIWQASTVSVRVFSTRAASPRRSWSILPRSVSQCRRLLVMPVSAAAVSISSPPLVNCAGVSKVKAAGARVRKPLRAGQSVEMLHTCRRRSRPKSSIARRARPRSPAACRMVVSNREARHVVVALVQGVSTSGRRSLRARQGCRSPAARHQHVGIRFAGLTEVIDLKLAAAHQPACTWA
jgi:hypothetical protein